MQLILWLLMVAYGMVEIALCSECNERCGKNIDKTVIDSNVERFHRILRRKKRFLLFPPGSALVTTMSFTKTLVPRSPSGINMIGECDIFYPLQTKIEDWYPTKKPVNPPPPPPQQDDDDDTDEDDDDNGDSNKNVLPNNVGPTLPPSAQGPNEPFPYENPMASIPQPLPPPPPPPQLAPINDDTMSQSSQSFLPTPVNQLDDASRLPSDQELGITPGTIISDPNYNSGSHPGEIYVDNDGKKRKTPPRRYDDAYYKLTSQPYYKRYPYYSYSNSSNYPLNKYYNNYQSLHKEQQLPTRKVDYRRPSNEIYYSDVKPTYYEGNYLNEDALMKERLRYIRNARERRDIFQQMESLISFKQFDTKSCILRMICEAKHYLLPPGKSLFQDIFRVLFTLPIENEYNDDYTEAMKATESHCDNVYSKQCRYSILGYLMSKDRPIL